MSQNLLAYTIFQQVIFPQKQADHATSSAFLLHRKKRFSLSAKSTLSDCPLVIFDFETTGLDANYDQIIEIGAIRVENFQETQLFSTLIDPQQIISKEIEHLTGISNTMVQNQPLIEEVLPKFLKFIDGCLLVAHNAEFDMGFLRVACLRLGIELEWPALCTLKMARVKLAQLESKSLDSLAQHFQLNFESRHRSVGDIRVTKDVLKNIITLAPEEFNHWSQLQPYTV